jgi:hypothetical protein
VRGPPHLVVGRRDDLPDQLAGDGAADRGVQVGGAAALGFDGGEVLHVPADRPSEILDEAVEQLAEVQGVAGGAAVVVALRVAWGAVGADRSVGGQSQRHEGRRAVGLAVRGLEHPPRSRGPDREAREVRNVLASAGGAGPPLRPGLLTSGRGGAADTLGSEHRVGLLDGGFDLEDAGHLAGLEGGSVVVLEIGSLPQQRPLAHRRLLRRRLGFLVEVPALAGLPHPQPAGPLGAGSADRGAGGAARDRDDGGRAGLPVDAPDRQGADARPDLLGRGLRDLTHDRAGQLPDGHRPGVAHVLGAVHQEASRSLLGLRGRRGLSGRSTTSGRSSRVGDG